MVLSVNTQFNRVRRRLGFGHWSVPAWLKQNTKSAVRYLTGFEEGMVRLARKHRVHGVICGYIHRAEERHIQGLRYLNCGDWVESCTAPAEDFDGRFHTLRGHEGGNAGSGASPARLGTAASGLSRDCGRLRTAGRRSPPTAPGNDG